MGQSKIQLPGVWNLLSLVSIRPNGEAVTGWLGPRPTGLLIYHTSGHMAVQLVRDPPAASFDAYYAYYGRYEVDEHQGVLRHIVERSLWPSEVGVTFEHRFKLAADRLRLEGPPFEAEGERRYSRLEWVRVG